LALQQLLRLTFFNNWRCFHNFGNLFNHFWLGNNNLCGLFNNRRSHNVSHRFGFSGDFFCNGRIRCSDNLWLFLDRGRNDFRMRGFNLVSTTA
jgi:hypothetical protein